MAPKVPISESGTATLGMTVPAAVRRNTNTTSTTRPIESMSSHRTSSTDARMVVVRSVSTETWTAEGSEACSCGSSALMRSATAMTLAPGCRWTLRITAGTSFIHAAWRTFSASSITPATSPRTTGAPLR